MFNCAAQSRSGMIGDIYSAAEPKHMKESRLRGLRASVVNSPFTRNNLCVCY
jgi:hypothetical protein